MNVQSAMRGMAAVLVSVTLACREAPTPVAPEGFTFGFLCQTNTLVSASREQISAAVDYFELGYAVAFTPYRNASDFQAAGVSSDSLCRLLVEYSNIRDIPQLVLVSKEGEVVGRMPTDVIVKDQVVGGVVLIERG
ncbi:MAG: hypothetical protein ACT4PU_05440 [Planctomycetota bacterium]